MNVAGLQRDSAASFQLHAKLSKGDAGGLEGAAQRVQICSRHLRCSHLKPGYCG
jgi:hypothetical protein